MVGIYFVVLDDLRQNLHHQILSEMLPMQFVSRNPIKVIVEMYCLFIGLFCLLYMLHVTCLYCMKIVDIIFRSLIYNHYQLCTFCSLKI